MFYLLIYYETNSDFLKNSYRVYFLVWMQFISATVHGFENDSLSLAKIKLIFVKMICWDAKTSVKHGILKEVLGFVFVSNSMGFTVECGFRHVTVII